MEEVEKSSFDEHQKYLRNQKRYDFYSKAKRKVNKIKITVARYRNFLKILLLAFLIWCAFTLPKANMWFLQEDIFSNYPNPYLHIEGNQIVSEQNILGGLKNIEINNDPIYKLNTNPLISQIQKLSPVDKVFVRRFLFPARLKIVVNEKTPIIAIRPSIEVDPVAVFTEDGTIITKEFLPLNYNKKVYSFISFDDYTKWSNKHIYFLTKLVRVVEKNANQEIQYVDIRNPDDVYIQLENIKLRIGELNKTVFKRASFVGAVIAKIENSKYGMNNIKYIDLRWEKAPSVKLKKK